MVPLKNTSSLHFANSLIVCRFSASLPKRRNATTSKVDTLFSCSILWKAYFRQCSWHCLKTLRVCLSQTSRIVCRFSASLPKRRNATVFENWHSLDCCILMNHINRRFLYHIIRTGCWITNPYTYCCKSAEFCFSSCAFEELLELIPHTDTDIEFHTDRRYFSPSSFGVFYYLFYSFWLIHLKTEH